MADTALADGTYQLVNAANVALALDDTGNSYANVSNVRLWTRNTTNAQIVRVWTRSDGSRQLAFAGSGKAIDVTNANFSHGANVAIYDCNDTDAQKWTIVAVSGKTVTVDSTAYPCWKIYLTKTYGSTSKFLLEADGTGTPANGANLCISEDESTSTDQMWAFVPLSPVADGTYVLRSVYTQDLVADLEGSSHSAGARVCVSSYHVGTGPDYGNNQVVRIKTDAKTGRSKLYFMHSGLLMEIAGKASDVKNGSQVVQSNDEGTSKDQMWVIVPDGSATLNGVNVPSYGLQNAAVHDNGGTTFCLDVTNGRAWAGTYLQLYEQNHSKAQRWILDPAQYTTQGLQSPSVLGIAQGTSEEYATLHTVNSKTSASSATWRACWKGTAAAYQCRYRYRMRYAPTAVWELWRDWQSCGDNSFANSGWGYAGTSTKATKAGGIWYSPSITTETCDGTYFDCCQIEVEVRSFATDGGIARNSPSVSTTSTCIFIPTATASSAKLDYEGLHVGWSFDQWPSGIWDASLTSILDGDTELLAEPVALSGKSGSWCVPYSQLCDIPASGDSLTCTFQLGSSTVSGVSVSTVACTYAAKATIVPDATYSVTDRLTVALTMARHALDGIYVIPGHGKPMQKQDIVMDGTMGTWDVEAPMGTASLLIVCHQTDDTWCVTKKSVTDVLPLAYVWTWTDSRSRKRAAVLYTGRNDTPSSEDSRSTDATGYTTVGAELPVYRAPKATKRTLDASGSMPVGKSIDSGRYAACSKWSTREAFEELLDQRRAVYRSPDGLIAKVYVSGYDMPRKSEHYVDVSISQMEEGR